MLEKSIEFNNPLYLVFIDFTKAFDSIKLLCLWTLLEQTSTLDTNFPQTTMTLQHRIGLGWAAFEKNKYILTSPLRIKAKTYNTYILPVLLYGLDFVNWKVTTLNKIENFQNHIMRFMTNKQLTILL